MTIMNFQKAEFKTISLPCDPFDPSIPSTEFTLSVAERAQGYG